MYLENYTETRYRFYQSIKIVLVNIILIEGRTTS